MNPILLEKPDVGVVYDANLARKARSFTSLKGWDPLNGFGLKDAYISEDCSKRAKKKRKSWFCHPDATPIDLVTSLKETFALFKSLLADSPDFGFSAADAWPEIIDQTSTCVKDHCQNLVCHPSSKNSGDHDIFYSLETKPVDWIFTRAQIEFVVPADARFWNGDIVKNQDLIEKFLIPPNGFRLCVVDPPWPSKSRGVKVDNK